MVCGLDSRSSSLGSSPDLRRHSASLYPCVKKVLSELYWVVTLQWTRCVKANTICFIWLFAELVTNYLFTVVAIRHFRVLGSEREVFSVR